MRKNSKLLFVKTSAGYIKIFKSLYMQFFKCNICITSFVMQ